MAFRCPVPLVGAASGEGDEPEAVDVLVDSAGWGGAPDATDTGTVEGEELAGIFLLAWMVIAAVSACM